MSIVDPTCGSEARAMVTCIEHTCSGCGDASCTSEAEDTYCENFVLDSQCIEDEQDDITCFPSTETTDEQFTYNLLVAFCSH